MTSTTLAALVLALGMLDPGVSRASARGPEPLPKSLRLDASAAPSMDALLERFLRALTAKDHDALRRLRVNEKEYLEIIVPGNVEPGQPPQRLTAPTGQYFWNTLDGKSAYSAQALLNEFGGSRYTVRDVTYDKGTKQFAWFTGYRQLRITVEDEQGARHVIETGSVAEVRGKFKFVSFVRD